jgi:predicted metal-dependent peptidase
MNQSDRIDQARIAVILASPFFGSLLMRLSMERDNSKKTFCTNGRRIAYNEDYCATLSDSELRGVLVHEVAHCAQGHLWRIGGREPDRWNRATDYSINNFLATFVAEESEAARLAGTTYVIPWTLPKGVLLDPQFADLCSEDIYTRLPKGKPRDESDGGGAGGAAGDKGPPSCGEFEQPEKDADDGKPTLDDALEGEWQVAVTQAATIAKMRGDLPASLKRMIGDLLEPKVSWRQVLREFIRIHSKDDYCWSRPNRRYLAQGIILPSLHSERMGRIVFGVDTSGSIDADTLAEFGSEIQAALDECRPEAMDVIYCDAAVNGVREFLPGDAVKLEALGGGGTRFAPVFEHIVKMDDAPVCCIYLTDGHGTFPAKEPDYSVLWAWCNRHSSKPPHFPFGEVVTVK